MKTKVAETQTEEDMRAIVFPFNVESALRFFRIYTGIPNHSNYLMPTLEMHNTFCPYAPKLGEWQRGRGGQ